MSEPRLTRRGIFLLWATAIRSNIPIAEVKDLWNLNHDENDFIENLPHLYYQQALEEFVEWGRIQKTLEKEYQVMAKNDFSVDDLRVMRYEINQTRQTKNLFAQAVK